MIERCDVPPPGWRCSREKGHEGPCAATLVVAFDPNAPSLISKLPAYWDERRVREGKPDASRCGADLRQALEFTLRVLRKRARELQAEHNHDTGAEPDEYMLGHAHGLVDAADLLDGLIPIHDVKPDGP